MFDKLMDQQFVLYVLAGVSVVVFLQKIMVSLLYRHLRRETDALPASNDRWIKQLKLKFENTYKMNTQIPDVEVFVDRQVEKLKFFRLGLYGMNTFYRKAQLICILLGGCSYVLAARAGRTTADCNAFFLMGILAAVFLQLLDSLSGNSHSAEMMKLNLTDYFENMLLPKLSQEPGSGTGIFAEDPGRGKEMDLSFSANEGNREPAKEEERGRQSTRQRQKEEIAAADIQKRLSRISQSKLSREEEDRIVRDVLKEFLT